jgi:hypothetical protein
MEDQDFIIPTWVRQNLEALSNVIGKDTFSKLQKRRSNQKDHELDLFQEDNKQNDISADHKEINDPYSLVSKNIMDNSQDKKPMSASTTSKKTHSKTSADQKNDIYSVYGVSPTKITKNVNGVKALAKDTKERLRVPAAERQKRCRERKKNYDKLLEEENKILKDQNIALVRELKECKQKVWTVL